MISFTNSNKIFNKKNTYCNICIYKFILIISHIIVISNTVFSSINESLYLAEVKNKYEIPGILAMVVKNGWIVAQGSSGVRLQGDGTAITITDHVNIGSCTKWITATLAGRLVDKGIIQWNTRVSDVFPNYQQFHPSFHNATIEQFLANRSGMQSGASFYSKHSSALWSLSGNATATEIRRWVSEKALSDPPEVEPGKYLYANEGFVIAGSMMEIVTGRDWESLIQEEIFRPLRMRSGQFVQVYDGKIPPSNPVGHDAANGSSPAPRTPFTQPFLRIYESAIGPAGIVSCTLEDWANFLDVHAKSNVQSYLSPNSVAKLQNPFLHADPFYGLGVFSVDRNWAWPGKALSHSGSIFGLQSVFWMAPAHDFMVMVFINCSEKETSLWDGGFQAMDEVASEFIQRYLNARANGPLLTSRRIPDKPRELQIDLDSSQRVKVSWQQADGAFRYKVFRNGAFFANSLNTSIIDDFVESSQTYSYTVVAFNAV